MVRRRACTTCCIMQLSDPGAASYIQPAAVPLLMHQNLFRAHGPGGRLSMPLFYSDMRQISKCMSCCPCCRLRPVVSTSWSDLPTPPRPAPDRAEHTFRPARLPTSLSTAQSGKVKQSKPGFKAPNLLLDFELLAMFGVSLSRVRPYCLPGLEHYLPSSAFVHLSV